MRETARQKYSVTELKKLRIQEESDAAEELYPETDMVPLIPQFIQKTEEKTGAARGTIYHTVMEWLDFYAQCLFIVFQLRMIFFPQF